MGFEDECAEVDLETQPPLTQRVLTLPILQNNIDHLLNYNTLNTWNFVSIVTSFCVDKQLSFIYGIQACLKC